MRRPKIDQTMASVIGRRFDGWADLCQENKVFRHFFNAEVLSFLKTTTQT